jgi:predicted kinase
MRLYPRLYIPVGLPGCGKSTLAHNLLGEAAIISTDEIRAELSTVDDQSKNKQVFETFHSMVDACLGNRQSTYADATNLDARARDTLRHIGFSNKAEVHVFLFTNVKEAIIRNSQRERRVPDDVMLRFIYKLEDALTAVPHESYTSITEIGGVQGVSINATYL